MKIKTSKLLLSALFGLIFTTITTATYAAQSESIMSLFIFPVRQIQSFDYIPWEPHVRFKPGTLLYAVTTAKENLNTEGTIESELFIASKRIEELIKWDVTAKVDDQILKSYSNNISKSLLILKNNKSVKWEYEKKRSLNYTYLNNHKNKLGGKYTNTKVGQTFDQIYMTALQELRAGEQQNYPYEIRYELTPVSDISPGEYQISVVPDTGKWSVKDQQSNMVTIRPDSTKTVVISATAMPEYLRISEDWSEVEVDKTDYRYYKAIYGYSVSDEYYTKITIPQMNEDITVTLKEVPIDSYDHQVAEIPDKVPKVHHINTKMQKTDSIRELTSYVQFISGGGESNPAVLEIKTQQKLDIENQNLIKMDVIKYEEPLIKITKNITKKEVQTAIDKSKQPVSQKNPMLGFIIAGCIISCGLVAVIKLFKRRYPKLNKYSVLCIAVALTLFSSNILSAIYLLIMWLYITWEYRLARFELIIGVSALLVYCILSVLSVQHIIFLRGGLLFISAFLSNTCIRSVRSFNRKGGG